MWEEVIMEQLTRVRFFCQENEREISFWEAKQLPSVNILAVLHKQLVVKRGRVDGSEFISDHNRYFIADYIETCVLEKWAPETIRLGFALAFYDTAEGIKILSDLPSVILNHEKGRKVYIVGMSEGDGQYYYARPCVIDVQSIGYDNTISSKKNGKICHYL